MHRGKDCVNQALSMGEVVTVKTRSSFSFFLMDMLHANGFELGAFLNSTYE